MPGESRIDRDRVSGYESRLITEVLRYHEANAGPLDDPRADTVARNADGDLEHRIIVRAQYSVLAPPLTEALHHVQTAIRIAFALGAAIAFVAGLATAHTALTVSAGTPVNFHWALLSCLGVETLALILWIIFASVGGKVPASPSLGGLVSAMGRRIAGWIHRGAAWASSARAVSAVITRGAIFRWRLGVITHGIWLAFLVGTLAMTILTLSVKQVSFAWETTILSEESYLPITEALAALPRLSGFPTPSENEIQASRWIGQSAPPVTVSRAWAGLLLGSLTLYGLVPRLFLLALCLFKQSHAARTFRLDLDLPEYQRLRERLMPSAGDKRVVDGGGGPIRDQEITVEPIATIEFDGPVALLGLEIELPATGWPPDLAQVDWRNLGLVDSRDDRERILQILDSSPPGLLLVAVSLLIAPDRGMGAFLVGLRQATDAPVVLLLTDGSQLCDRLGEEDARQRVQDWHRLGATAGIPANRVMEFDLTHPGERDHHRLAELLGIGRS
jgi:hypothetical protein